MNSENKKVQIKEIGGYIELDLGNKENYFHKHAIYINSGRNGIKYAIRAYNIKQLWVPYYTCPVVWQAIKEEQCECKFYSIGDDLQPILNCSENEYVLYTNYFGVCSEKIRQLSIKYKNLIIDNAQAFYMKPYGIASAYSPRKFFGCSDGGIVYCNKKIDKDFERDYSWNRFSHLLKRLDVDSNFGYDDFNKNDDSLIGEDIKRMSNLTNKILANIDYEYCKMKRLKNYKYLQSELDRFNSLKTKITDDVPMYYPLLIENNDLRQKLVDEKIYIPKCWRNMEKNCKDKSYELYLQKYMHPLIIDQRYDIHDMDRIVKIIKKNY